MFDSHSSEDYIYLRAKIEPKIRLSYDSCTLAPLVRLLYISASRTTPVNRRWGYLPRAGLNDKSKSTSKSKSKIHNVSDAAVVTVVVPCRRWGYLSRAGLNDKSKSKSKSKSNSKSKSK
eukprot:5233860-Pyramimonas_sp.AAC.1